jgi:CheY-like chemotaxis protein
MEGKPKILVVEDEAALQEAIKVKLVSEGFDYIAAISAEEAFVFLETGRPDIIWLDLLMPGMGGFAFLEKLRIMPELKDLPVVIVSVSASPEKIKRAFELNVVDYIVKSQYKLGDIISRLRSFLSKAETKE